MQQELLKLERRAQAGLDVQPLDRVLGKLGRADLIVVTAPLLRPVHGVVRAAQQGFRVGAVVGVDAHAD